MHVRHVGVIALMVLGAAACGSSSSKSGTSSGAGSPGSKTAASSTKAASPSTSGGAYGGAYGATPSTTAATAPATTGPVKLAKVGTDMLVVDGSGKTVYSYAPDTATSAACTGGCAQAWPPVTATSAPPATIGGLSITTLTRSDGTKQVVVNGHPVYTFSGDLKPGDKNGEGVGGVWYYLNAQGQPDKG